METIIKQITTKSGVPINGAFLISTRNFQDDRGNFYKTFDDRDLTNFFVKNKINEKFRPGNWVSFSFVRNKSADIFRGMHRQGQIIYCQTKMVSCIDGAILDFFIDKRSGSNTHGEVFSIELSLTKDFDTIIIPRGCFHGYLTLTKDSLISYKTDNYYNPDAEEIMNYKHLNSELLMRIEDSLIISPKDFHAK